MGLFDGIKQRKAEKRERIQAVESELMRALAQTPLLDALISTIIGLSKEESWITEGEDLNDNCQRHVRFDADRLQISRLHIYTEWVTFGSGDDAKERERFFEDIIREKGLSYSDQGYGPLGEYKSKTVFEPKKGTPLCVSNYRVVEIWAEIIRERLQLELPGCVFGEITEIKHISLLDVDFGFKTLPADCDYWYQFTYTVPKKTLKSWY